MNCPKCQTALPDSAKFCARCGSDLRAAQENPVQQACGEAPQVPYREQFQQYREPQPPYQQPQGEVLQQVPSSAVLTQAQPKNKSRAVPVIIVVAAILLTAGIVFGVFFGLKGCNNAATGSYKDALNDAMALMSAGKIDEALEKYSIGGSGEPASQANAVFNMIGNVKVTVDVNDDKTKVYSKGTEEFDDALSYITSDKMVQAQISEIVYVDAEMTVSGNVLGQAFDRSDDTTFYMARINGQWKFGGSSPFTVF